MVSSDNWWISVNSDWVVSRLRPPRFVAHFTHCMSLNGAHHSSKAGGRQTRTLAWGPRFVWSLAGAKLRELLCFQVSRGSGVDVASAAFRMRPRPRGPRFVWSLAGAKLRELVCYGASWRIGHHVALAVSVQRPRSWGPRLVWSVAGAELREQVFIAVLACFGAVQLRAL